MAPDGTKKKISFAQVNFQLGPKEFNSFHLPYTAGCLWAHAQSHADVKDRFELNQLIWRRQDIVATARDLQHDTVVGFCTYVWNLKYNLELARRVREINPQCLIVFGGPEPAVTDPSIFQKHAYIDVIVKNEGEVTFLSLLRNLDRIDSVTGLLWNNNGHLIDTGAAARVEDLSQLTSPYLSGVFDTIMSSNPDVRWAATLETNRGCPYACTFCDWGSLTLSKIKKFPEQKIYQELEWMSRNHIDFVSIADANFGIFPQRDKQIIEKFIQYQRIHGAPAQIHAFFAKNQNTEVLDIVELLIKKTLHPTTGLKVSLQSLNDRALTAIKRKNLKINNINEILEIGRQRDIPIGTELILGLPGETLTSWQENFWLLLEIGIHEDIDVYYCQLFENAEMNLVQKQIYDIQTVRIYDYFSPHASDNIGVCAESVEVVKSTIDMDFNDLLEASIMSWNIFTWHVGGYSNLVIRFLRKYTMQSYQQLYQPLFDLAAQQSWYQALRQQQLDMLQQWFDQGRCFADSGIDGIKIYGYNIIFHTRMLLASRPDMANQWYELLDRYVSGFDLGADLHRDIMDLQINQVVRLETRSSYPMIRDYQHNVWEYINHQPCELSHTPTQLRYDFPEPAMSDIEFVERIFWSRRRRFGKTWITTI
jgi:tRNA A37 methylthiotransferase MiaB